MFSTDLPVICIIESSLILFTLFAAFREARIRRQERASGIDAEVIRGDKSMITLYAVYGATISSFLVLLNNAFGIDGNKVVLILINFICVTYLFFFSTWFRNSILFAFNQRLKKD